MSARSRHEIMMPPAFLALLSASRHATIVIIINMMMYFTVTLMPLYVKALPARSLFKKILSTEAIVTITVAPMST